MTNRSFNFTIAKVKEIPYATTGSTLTYKDTGCKGLKLKVGKDRKTFVLEKRIKGKTGSAITFKLGIFSYRNEGFAMDVKDARQKALHYANLCAEGIDPRSGKVNKDRTVPLREAIEVYYKVRKLKPTTLAGYKSIIKNHIKDWLERDLRVLASDDLVERFVKIRATAPAQATGMLRLISAVWNTGSPLFREGGDRLLPQNPVPEAQKTLIKWKEDPKKRPIIPERKLGEWVYKIEKWRLDPRQPILERRTCSLLLVSLFCGFRNAEARSLKWENIDLDEGVIKITSADSKNKTEHQIPLHSLIKELLKSIRKDQDPNCIWVFPSKTKNRAMGGCPYFYKKFSKEFNLYFRAHATRRTFLSIGGELDISPLILKRLVNHLYKGDVTEQYMSAAFNPSKNRRVIELIGDFIIERRDEYVMGFVTHP